MPDHDVQRTDRTLARLLLGHLPGRRDRSLQDLATALLRDQGGHSPVLDLVNNTLVVRRDLTYWLRLEPRRLWSRLTYRPVPHAGSDRVLSLLCPSRGRVDNLGSFLRSLHRTAVKPGRVEVMVYVDEDDPALPAYHRLFDRAPRLWPGLGACRLVVGPPEGVPQAWNALAAQSRGDLLMMANDDQLYVDHGWDTTLDNRVTQLTALHGDDVLCLYFDDGQYTDGGRDFPIVTRTWYETLGYFTPTIFQQWEVERWVFDVALRLERCHVVPGVFVEHRHYQDYKAPFDETYQRHRVTREKSLADHALFLGTEAQRAAEAERLRGVMSPGPRPGSAAPAATLTAATAETEPAATHAAQAPKRAEPYGSPAESAPSTAHADPPPAPATTLLPEPWFAGRLTASRARMADEAAAWRERVVPGAAPCTVPLWTDGRPAADSEAHFAATLDVLASIPEIGAADDGTAVLEWWPAGSTAPGPGGCPGRSTTLLPLSGIRGVRLRLGGRPAHPWPADGCITFAAAVPRETRNDGPEGVLLLALSTARPAADDRSEG
ncbi:glycosyltransferase family 2 protein [Streptomyces massasporeus]|uniref:glycosyltransferase family 2 protein n=1 Tax=Streptomyces massasporeus TaxID=67324 RepID=UPI0036FC8CFE